MLPQLKLHEVQSTVELSNKNKLMKTFIPSQSCPQDILPENMETKEGVMIVVQTQEQSRGHPLEIQWQRTHFHFRGRHLEAQLQFHPEVPLDVPHQLQAIMLVTT